MKRKFYWKGNWEKTVYTIVLYALGFRISVSPAGNINKNKLYLHIYTLHAHVLKYAHFISIHVYCTYYNTLGYSPCIYQCIIICTINTYTSYIQLIIYIYLYSIQYTVERIPVGLTGLIIKSDRHYGKTKNVIF